MQTEVRPSPVFRIYCIPRQNIEAKYVSSLTIQHKLYKYQTMLVFHFSSYLHRFDVSNITSHVIFFTCSGVSVKGLLPMVNVTFGMVEMLLQLITDSPAGLGRLSQSCQNPEHKHSIQLCFFQQFRAQNNKRGLKITHLIDIFDHFFFGFLLS